MTEQDVVEIQDAALGKYVRATWTANASRARLDTLAKEMGEFAEALRTVSPSVLASTSFNKEWLNEDFVQIVVKDVDLAQQEAANTRQAVENLGVAIPYGK